MKPKREGRLGRSRRKRWAIAAAGGLFAVNLAAQMHYLRAYPQPQVVGDPGAYYEIAQRWWHSLREASGEDVGLQRRALRRMERLAPFAAVGLAYGGVDALIEDGPEGIYRYHALLGAGTGLLLFLTVYRLTGSLVGGVLAQLASLFYVTYTVISGIALPEPTGIFLGSAAMASYAEALARRRHRWLVLSGFLLGLGFLFRPQNASYLLILLMLLLILLIIIGRGELPRAAAAYAGGLLLPALAWGWIVLVSWEGSPALAERYGLWSFDPPFEVGFWLFLDSDGWQGPFGTHDNPYGIAYQEAAARDPAIAESGLRRKWFTLQYVAGRPLESLRAVVLNLYRFMRFPDNTFKVDYLLPYGAQVWYQGALVLVALISFPVLAVRAPALLALYIVPLSLAFLYSFYAVLTKYNLPATPFIIAAAAGGSVILARSVPPLWRDRRARRLGTLSLIAGLAALACAPETARVLAVDPFLVLLLRLTLFTAFLVGSFAFFSRLASAGSWARQLFLATPVVVLVPYAWTHLGYHEWHEFRVNLGDHEYEQRLSLGPDGRRALVDAREAFLLFDLEVPTGDLGPLEVRMGETVLGGADLRASMPPYRAATWVGGRKHESVPQWWAIPFRSEWLDADDTLRIQLRWTADPKKAPWLFGDLPSFVTRGVYQGPSFGNALGVSLHKLKYDGSYRFLTRVPLSSVDTRSFQDGREMFGYLRIRAVSLESDLGGVSWASTPVPASRPTRLVFEARSGVTGDAELRVCDRAFPIELRALSLRKEQRGGVTLSVHPLAEDEFGARYELSLPDECAAPGQPVQLEVRYLANLVPAHKERDRFFEPRPSAHRSEGELQGFSRLLSHRPYRHWTVDQVF